MFGKRLTQRTLSLAVGVNVSCIEEIDTIFEG
jgi:hypothetical protein